MLELSIIKYKASWCGNCKMLTKVLDIIKPKFPQIKFSEVDVDDQKELASSANVTTIPALYFYQDGQKIGESLGVLPPEKLTDKIKRTFHI